MFLGKSILLERIALDTYSLCVPVLEAMKSQYLSNKLEFFRITVVDGRCAKNPNHTFWLLLGAWSSWQKY